VAIRLGRVIECRESIRANFERYNREAQKRYSGAPAVADLKTSAEALRPAEMRLLHNTRPFNVWGLPAISVPCGLTQNGLPIGLQIAVLRRIGLPQ
jgi:aspartyl-tRNA(Asn)/glutamyl-tRNA(Gln) amidotransferase subunit A